MVAQLVCTQLVRVRLSYVCPLNANVTQLVESLHAMQKFVGSSPIVRLYTPSGRSPVDSDKIDVSSSILEVCTIGAVVQLV